MKVNRMIKPLLSIVLALLLGAVVILLIGENPVTVYSAMFNGAFGSKNAIAGTLVKTTTMIFVGLSYGFAYKCGLVNIGIEGQLYLGGLLCSLAAIYIQLPAILHIPLCLLAGFAGGGAWGAVVGFLKTRFRASEMITTVMMNYVAIFFVGYMVNGPIKAAKGTYPQSEPILKSAQLPTLVPKTQLTIGVLIAIAAIVIYSVFWKKTALGYEMEMVGSSEQVARYGGIPVDRIVVWSMTVSGGLGGLAGCMEVLGVQHKIMEGLSAGYGFDGIAVSLLGGNGGAGILLSSFLFGVLRYGGNAIQMFTKLPNAVIYILQALIILFVVVDVFRRGRKEGAACQ